MSAKKKYEYREKKSFNRETDGLKQRRLKDETRWKFNPNETYTTEDDQDDEDEYENWEQYRQGG